MNLESQKKYFESKLEEVDSALKKKEDYSNDLTQKPPFTRFYHFDQNNSGGHMIINEDVCENVFIEAHSPNEANILADNIGIYFDGCSTGNDCSCCGDRWYPQYGHSEGLEKPALYQSHLEKKVDVHECYSDTFNTRAIIYYLDGRKEIVDLKNWDDGHAHQWKKESWGSCVCVICNKWDSELRREGDLQ